MPAKSVVMDSSKFLSTINSSAQARIVQYENAVKSLGARIKSDWRLAALNTDKLFIENVTTGEYLEAKHARVKGGRISISDITPIKIVENKKQTTFESSCLSLVNAIEENDSKGMRSAFNSLAAQRFSPNSVPADGLVRTRDGAIRKLNVVREGFDDTFKTKLVAALVESVTDTVIVEGNQIISANLSEIRRKLPISEWACRKVVGQKMRDVASRAYLSEGFQIRVKHIAGLIAEDRVQDAVKIAAKFLAENQEFSLLTKAETTNLIENTLAAKAIMNQRLCEDVATLMFRTSLHVNKKDIVKEWKVAASRAQHPALMENVTRLESAKNFEASYDNFLKRAFCEAMSPRDEEINAYRAALGLLQNTQQVREDQELKGKIEELMHKLASTEVDGSTINLVREALAAAKKEVDQMQNLDDFDEIPGDEAAALGGDMAPAMDGAAGGGQPTIVINSPLINFGTEPGGAPGPEDEMADLGDDALGDELGGDDMGMGGEGDLGADSMGGGDDLGADPMGGGDDMGMGGEEEDDDLAALLDSGEEDDNDQLDLSSIQRRGSGLAEDNDWLKKTIAKRKGEKTDDDSDDDDDSEDCDPECGEMDESADPYAYNALTSRTDIGIGYGKPVLEGELPAIVTSLYNLVEDRDLDAEAIAEQFVQLVKAAISDNGVHIPANKLDEAVQLVAGALAKSLNTLGEDQYKWGTALRRRGLGRSDFAGPKKSGGGGGGGSSDSGFSGDAPEAEEGLTGNAPTVQTESIRWDQHDKAAHGISGQLKGVGFIVDYANPPALLDAAGRIEVPMPSNVLESALASAGLSRGNKQVFNEWLHKNIEQLRPYSAADDAALNEAVAIVTAGADGTVTVQVDGATVGEMGGEMGGAAGGMEDPMMGGMDDMDPNGMAPVDDMGADDPMGGEMGADAMPDFEAGDEAGMPDFGPGGEGPEDDLGGEGGPEGPDDGQDGPPGPPQAGGDDMVVDDGEVEEESGPPVKEDKDITDPESDKYRTFVNDDPRTPPKEAGKGQKPSGDGKSLEGFNKENDTMGKTSVELKSVKPGGLRK